MKTLGEGMLYVAGYGNSDGGWVFIASPLAGSVAPTAVSGLVADPVANYDLYRFNQSASLEWENYKNTEHTSGFQLVNGTGYLYASKQDVTLVFTGTPYTGDGKVTLSKTPSATLEGWNLVGNPFNETAYIDRPFYVMNSNGSEIIAAEDANRSSIAPMEGVFVMANEDGETMTFTTTVPDNNGKGFALNLSQGKGVIDRAIVRFGEGRQLPKFQIRENSTKVYIAQDGLDYAVVNSDRAGEMPVRFKAAENGEYTISVNPEGVEMEYLHLIDNLTGNDIDLLQTPYYTFEGRTTDYANRFKLVFRAGEVAGEVACEPFAYVSDGQLIIDAGDASNGDACNASLQVFDALGHQLFSKELSVFRSPFSVSHFPSGVYVLRLINGNEVKTQKIVIE